MSYKKSATLEDIFLHDPMEIAIRKVDMVEYEVKKAFPQYLAGWEKVGKALHEIYGEPGKPDIFKKLRELISRVKDWRERVDETSCLLGVEPYEFESYHLLNEAMRKAVKKRVINPYKATFKRLVKKSSVKVISKKEFPSDADRPFIVFYSADWCQPCQLTKPAFVRLSRFFDRAKLYHYSSDKIFDECPDVKFVPQLVAYLPNGAKVHSECGDSAKELWQNMNLLVTLGINFKGTGELVCSETDCRIEPKKEAYCFFFYFHNAKLNNRLLSNSARRLPTPRIRLGVF